MGRQRFSPLAATLRTLHHIIVNLLRTEGSICDQPPRSRLIGLLTAPVFFFFNTKSLYIDTVYYYY